MHRCNNNSRIYRMDVFFYFLSCYIIIFERLIIRQAGMIHKYEILQKVGNGNFSNVYLVKNKESGQCYAMKIMKTHQNIGVRQAQFLKKFDHPNIVKLYDFQHDSNLGETKMVLQYFPQNTLELYENQKYGLRQQQIKCILFQTALGLAYIHERGIIHRDIKPQNIVIDKTKAEILLIDFGLAIYSDKISTDYVATRWYRAPQNLLATKEYTTAIDVFSLACVIIQLYIGSPLFPGDDNIDQLYKIFNILGQPTQKEWPNGYKKLRQLGFKIDEFKGKLNQSRPIQFGLKQLLNNCNEGLYKLLSQMLTLNPKKRITSRDIVFNQYFQNVSSIIPPHIYSRFQKDFRKNSKKDVIQNAENAINNAKTKLNKIHLNNKNTPSFIKQLNSPLNFTNSINLNQKNMQYVMSSARLAVKDGIIYSKDAQDDKVRASQEERERFKAQLRQTQPQNSSQNQPNNTPPNIQQALSFRGFNTIKNNKLSINEIKKTNENQSKQKFLLKNIIKQNDMSSSSNHGMSVKKTVISKSIDLGNRFPNMNNNSNIIQRPILIAQRKLTQNQSPNRLHQDNKAFGNNSQILYYVNKRNTTPVKYFKSPEPRDSKNISIINNNESIRQTRNTSIITYHQPSNIQNHHQSGPQTPSIITDGNGSILRQRISHSPIAGVAPSMHNNKGQLASFKEQQDTNLYTQKLHSHLSQKNLTNYTPARNIRPDIFIEKNKSITVNNQFDSSLIKNNQSNIIHLNSQQFKERENAMKIKMNQVKSKNNNVKTQVSPQPYHFLSPNHQHLKNHLKNIKSLEKKEFVDHGRSNYNVGEQVPNKFSLNQMKYIKVNDVKNYREPWITMKKSFQPFPAQNNGQPFYHTEQDRSNISINLNVSIIEGQKNNNQKRNRI